MDDALKRPTSPTIRVTGWLLVMSFFAIMVGSIIAKIDIVARGTGRVIPSKRVQLVQPLADGKITNILVAEGASVGKGELLVSMETSASEGEIKRIEAEIDRQLQERVIANSILQPLASADPTDNKFVELGLSVLAKQEAELDTIRPERASLVKAILTALRDQIAQIDAQHNRLLSSENAQSARLEKARADRKILVGRFASAEALRKGGTISEYDYTERLRVVRAAEGDETIAEKELDELQTEQSAVRQQRNSAISEGISTYRKQLSSADIALGSLKAELFAARERLNNLSLRAPVDGRVENLSVHTLGSFVEAGTSVLSVVPNDTNIEIEAFFENRDIGFLAVGQQASIKFDAFPAERFGLVRGRVAGVGADARQLGSSNNWVYAVQLKPDTNGIRIGGKEIRFIPGMTATVDVVTGERRVIGYFFEPIVKALQDSFGER